MTDLVQKIDAGIGAVGVAAPPSAPPANVENGAFQRLLESLQKLADEQRRAPTVQTADDLRAALRAADDGFVTAMDLRQKLEAAFRSQKP